MSRKLQKQINIDKQQPVLPVPGYLPAPVMPLKTWHPEKKTETMKGIPKKKFKKIELIYELVSGDAPGLSGPVPCKLKKTD